MRKKISVIDRRNFMAVAYDCVAIALAWTGAYWLRLNLELPEHFSDEMLTALWWIIPLQAMTFWLFGLYRGVWRYASICDIRRILIAVSVSSLAIPLVFWLMRVPAIVPRAVLLLHPMLLIALMTGARLLYRAWKEGVIYGGKKGEPVLILGAGDAAVGLSKELARSQKWNVVGFLDDSRELHGRSLNGIPVLGGLDRLESELLRLSVLQVIIAMPEATHQQRKRAVDLCLDAKVAMLSVPSFDDLLSGKVGLSQLRPVELDDLLGRDPVELDDAGLHQLLTNQVVLVTGAGGSIGSELCRQIARFQPASLLLFDHGEFLLYTIEQELSKSYPDLRCEFVIGDVVNRERVEEVMATWKPAVVFHAAAYKHVPLMEKHNAWQALRNNVMGTWTLADAAIRHGVSKFVLISTDKAVNPTNVMGASKRLAEMVCQGMQQQGQTRFVMVRFGNVLGSNGSVIPKFREQIAQGGPITVTHPEITRFFMLIPEAAQLVLQAGLMGQGGEIFVLDMGEPVKIVDLARELIKLSGLREDEIRIEFSGLRPGEKLYEELLADDEQTLPTSHTKLRIAKARSVDAVWLAELLAWLRSAPYYSDDRVRADLPNWVPEYSQPPHDLA